MGYIQSFTLNGDHWNVRFVNPNSHMLMDRTGVQTVATTDPRTKTVYLSSRLHGDFLNRVLVHELGHCAMVSFHLLDDIHQMVKPEYWIDAEEWICNFIADYGLRIFSAAYHILGDAAWLYVPQEIERFVA